MPVGHVMDAVAILNKKCELFLKSEFQIQHNRGVLSQIAQLWKFSATSYNLTNKP